MWRLCEWLNEPAQWAVEHSGLHVTTEARTDFWRETGYGYTRDNGHFFGQKVERDFTATLRIRAKYAGQFDQAGLMIRIDESRWIKFGTEFFDGRSILSSVVTLDRSDWAIGAFAGSMDDFHVQATLKNGALHLEASQDGQSWTLMRLAPFPSSPLTFVGPMCCTPERAGLNVVFSNFDVELKAAG